MPKPARHVNGVAESCSRCFWTHGKPLKTGYPDWVVNSHKYFLSEGK